MKKILTSLLALFASCSLLSACSIVDDVKGWFDKGNASESQSEETSSTLDSVPEDTTSEDSTSEEPSTDPHVEAMELAKDFVYGSLIEKDLEVSKDYTLIKTFYSGILDEELTITWTVDVTEGVTLVEGETEWTVDVDEFAKEDIFYTLTATLADSDGHTATFTLDRKVLKAADVIPEKITEAPVEGEAYKLYMYQVTKKVDLYFTGAMSGFYLATNNTSKGEGYEKAVDVFVENVEGKDGYFYIYFNEKTEDSEGNETFVKQYFGISNTHNDKGWHVNAIYSPTNVVADGAVGTYEFTWSDKLGTFIATVEGVTYEDEDDNVVTNTSNFYFGTYSSYYTIGTSHVDNFDNDDACIVYFVKMVNKSEVSAEDKVAGEKETLNVTTAFSGAVEYTLPTQGTTYGDVAISWALKSDNATLTDNVLTLASPEAELKVVLTATFTCGEATTTKDVEITVYPKSLVELVSEPQENTAYVLYLYQANKAKNYYLTGAMDGNFLGTTDDATKAADVYAEKADNGIKIYVMDASGAKSYIKLTEYESSGKYKASVSFATEGSIFTYDSQFSMWKCNTGNEVFYLGTYNDYTTMSTSAASFVKVDNVGKTQFCANFGILDESALPPEGGEEGGDTPIVPEVTTADIATVIANKGTTFQTEGTVVGVYARGYIIKDSTGMILVYKPTAYDAKLGDKITVVGKSDEFNGGAQFAEGCVVTVKESGSVPMAIAESLTGAQCDELLSLTTVQIKYVSITGVLSISGSYYNVTMDDATTAVGSIAYPSEEIVAAAAELNGQEIVVNGYFFSISKASGSPKYINILATSVTAAGNIGDDKEECKHEYDKEGVCVHCGEKDPDFKPEEDVECEHEYDKEGVCVHCGEACEHSFVDGVCENCGAADPDYKPEEEKPVDQIAILEAAYALAKNETLENQTLTGVIVKIDTAYSTQFSNITVTILVEEMTDMPMLCYRIKGEGADTIKVGDTITVTGTIKNYNGTIEFDAGSALTAVDTEASVSEITKIYTEALALEVPNAVKEAGEVVLATTGETYADVAISWAADNDCVAINGGALTFTLPQAAATVTLTATVVCGEASEEYTFAVTVSAAPSADTLTAGFVASQLGLANSAVFSSKTVDNITFTAAKNTGGTQPAYYTSGNALRLYGKNTFTISCDAGYKIVSIAITTETGKNGINDSNCTITNATATGLGTASVLLTPVDGTAAVVMTNPASSGNFRIVEISVTYVPVA